MASVDQAYPDSFVRQLRVPIANHSHHTDTLGGLYNYPLASPLAPRPPKVPYYSTVDGRKVVGGKVSGLQYWQFNMEGPGLFLTLL